MSLRDARDPALTVDGELVAGRAALQVPVDVRTARRGGTATLEFEAQQTAARNRTLRLSDLSAEDVRTLRDELDALLESLE